MPTPRASFAIGEINGVLYAVGGVNNVGVLSTVEAYNPSTDSWSRKADMPTPRYGLAVAVANGILYAIGGNPEGGSPTAAVEAYNPATNTWSVKPPMPTARDELGAGVVDGIIYAVGGMNRGPLNTVEAFDPNTGVWYGAAPMRRSRVSHGIAVVGRTMYAFGGGLTNDPLALEAYNPVSNSWVDRARSPRERSSFAVGVLDGMLYAAGGFGSGLSMPTEIDGYNPRTDRWGTVAQMPTPRVGPAAGAANGVLYVMGGFVGSRGAQPSALNEALDFHIAPVISEGGVVNGASFRAPDEPDGGIAPGALVAIFGSNLAEATLAAESEPLPRSLGGATVTIDGIAAPLFFVSPQQINAQVPFETRVGTVRLVVARSGSTAEQIVAVRDVSPGIFLVGDGQGAVLDAETYDLIGPAHPARPGGYIAIWCTGLGASVPPLRTGYTPQQPPPETAVRPEATIGGTPATVLWAGAAPGLIAANQVNIQVPATVPPGRHMLVIAINGAHSNEVPILVDGS